MSKSKLRQPPASKTEQDFIRGGGNEASGQDSKKASDKAEMKRKPRYAGFYLPPDILTRLERARPELLDITGAAPGDISKSTIVEAALQLALDGLDEKKEDSMLVKKLYAIMSRKENS
jgi:hypothetical protein